MKLKLSLAAGMLSLCAFAGVDALLPRPQKVEPGEGFFVAKEDAASVYMKEMVDSSLPKEGYRLSVSREGLAVCSSDADGVFYARQTLRQLAENYNTMAAQLEKMDQSRNQFVSNASHELKTPLTSISGFAELMRSGLCDEDKMIEFAGDIYRESQRVIALINDIIRISELDEGEVHDEAEEVDLLKSAESAVRSLSHTAEKRSIKMTVTGPEEEGKSIGEAQAAGTVRVSGSAHLIEEIIYNLCDNAVKYNRDGGEVRVRVWNDGRNACVSVEDTGIGIPASEQERVFERFYRVDKSHSRKIGGTGLGLSIVKHAAQFHDAAIELDSEPGRGTKITLRFPHTVENI